MTAQIGDSFLFERVRYALVAKSAPIPFSPAEHGLWPSSTSTCCWRGYFCTYEITREQGLLLSDLFIHTLDGKYPPLCGVTPDARESDSYMGHTPYRKLKMKIDYTGRLLLGDKFLSKYYVHMGYQAPWAYEELTELVFQNGELVEVNDQSQMARTLREQLDARLEEEKDCFPTHEWVRQCFSLSYEDKAWWLPR